MGLLTNLLFFPVTGPVAGIKWTLGKVQRVVEEQLVDDTEMDSGRKETITSPDPDSGTIRRSSVTSSL